MLKSHPKFFIIKIIGIIGLLGFSFFPEISKAAVATAVSQGGDWNNPSTWDSGKVPISTDEVIFSENSGNVYSQEPIFAGSIRFEKGFKNTFTAGGKITVKNDIVISEGIIKSPDGTALEISAGRIFIEKEAILKAEKILITTDIFSNTGLVDTSGKEGGDIEIKSRNILQQGKIESSGLGGKGGKIILNFTNVYISSSSSRIISKGLEKGGVIHLDGSRGGQSKIFSSGTYISQAKIGGDIIFEALESIKLYGAVIDASSIVCGDLPQTATSGGNIYIGGAWQGGGGIAQAGETYINFDSSLKTNDPTNKAGVIVIWSRQKTRFEGTALAQSEIGQGGSIEISGMEKLSVENNSKINASSLNGRGGTVLFDPRNITISSSGISPTGKQLSYFQFTDPNPDNGLFGQTGLVIPLSTGNVVVAETGDDLMATDSGAVYLFNGKNGALISVLTGSSANDQVGSGVTTLSNGNYVVRSTSWDNGSTVNVGAVTWCNGSSGCTGAVSTSNSLHGSTANDNVGFGVTALPNGNYVVASILWDNGGTADVGAVTWCDGASGCTGAVSTSNSLHGSTASDQVGNTNITALSNGNYVVGSSTWDNGGTADVGAVTWCNGTSGCTGAVSTSNSLHGSTASDQVGNPGVIALTNGNYVVRSRFWDNGGTADVGAVTWCSGASGCTGAVSTSNSLHGSTASDQVGNNGVTALSNGNYVVRSPTWDNGGTADVGAATWCNGTSGCTGAVSTSNSLHGSTASDAVSNGGVIALPNGNYVVRSSSWDNGGTADVGAATWCSGTSGCTGAVSTSNSLHGSTASDGVSFSGVIVLSNGNYVVGSFLWDNGGTADVGAVTWCNGTSGCTGAVSTSNSLHGSTASDQVGGIDDGIIALSNGNYVVRIPNWDNGGTVNVGAVTWCSGTSGCTGAVSTSNSLHGSTASDAVGSSVTALSNGNYVVGSHPWDNGGTVNVGAVTWCNGTSGCTGAVSTSNSLHGSTASDQVGIGGVTALSNGNYVVRSHLWDDVFGVQPGAGTLLPGNETSTGPLTTANSVFGLCCSTISSDVFVSEDLANQRVIVSFQKSRLIYSLNIEYVGNSPNHYTFDFEPSVDYNLLPSFVTGILNTGTAVKMQANNDIKVDSAITASAGGNGGAFTLMAGRSILINAGIATDNGALSLVANASSADGVFSAWRNSGKAEITAADGVSLNSGAGAMSIIIASGAGSTYNNSGDIILRGTTSQGLTVRNNGPDGGSVYLYGAVSSAGSVIFSGPTILANDVNATSGSVTFSSPVTLAGHSVITTVNSPVSFADSINGNYNLSVSSGSGGLTVGGAIGAATPIGNFSLDSSGGTWTLAGPVTINGNFTITAGTVDVSTANCSGSSCPISLGGNWTNNGTFTSRTGTVTFSGSGSQSINGNNSWYNLILSPGAFPRTITFEAGKTQTIGNNFTALAGEQNVMSIDSSSSGSAATLSKSSGTVTVEYLSIQDSSAGGGATWNAIASIDVSGNSGWNFLTPTLVQKNFKIFKDNDSLTSADFYVGENLNYNIKTGVIFRLRFGVLNNGSFDDVLVRRLEFKENAGDWTQITTGSNNVRLADSSHFADGTATSPRLTQVGNFRSGQGKDTSSDTALRYLPVGSYVEDEYALSFQSEAAGKTYQFRITKKGSALTTYENLPVIVADDSPPAKTNFNPADGATIKTATPAITFTLNEAGDCRAATVAKSYDDMQSDVICEGAGTENQSCQMPHLGSNGSKTIYIACRDREGNKDTLATAHLLTLILNSSDSQPPSIYLQGQLKIDGNLIFK